MSHLTHIKTQIKNPNVLDRVLLSLIDNGLNGILAGAYLDRNAQIHDPFGNSKLPSLSSGASKAIKVAMTSDSN